MTTQFVRTTRGNYINPRFITRMNRVAYKTDTDPNRTTWEAHLSDRQGPAILSRETVQELVGRQWQEPPESEDD